MQNARKQWLCKHLRVPRQCHHRVTRHRCHMTRESLWHRIVTNTHYFVCHISRAINLIYYYWFEMYPCNKTYHINFMLQIQFVLCKAGENCIVVIRFNSLINPICVGARPIIRVEVMQFIWTLPNITRCIPPSVFVINFPYIQGVDTQVGSGALESLINCHQADIYFPITNSIGWETCYLNLDLEMISTQHTICAGVVFVCSAIWPEMISHVTRDTL